MARFTDQNAATKVTAASATVVFTAADFDAAGVVKLVFLFTGAGMTVGDITRIRVKNSGITSHDFSLAQYQAWYQRYYGIAPVAADTVFELPFHLPPDDVGGNIDAMDICQMLRGSSPAIELVIGAGGAAGTVQMGWVKSTVEPKLYPVLLGSTMQIGASQFSAHFPLSEGGAIKGVVIPITGLTRFQVTLGNQKRKNVEGTLMFGELEQQRNAQVVTDPLAADMGGPQAAPAGSSFFELDTAAGWAGAANEGAIYALRGQ